VTLPTKAKRQRPPRPTCPEARRAFLQWLGGTTLLPAAASTRAAPDAGRGHVRIEDTAISLQFDDQMRCRLVDRRRGAARALTRFDDSETLLGAKDKPLARFTLTEAHADTVTDAEHGPAQRLVLRGRSASGLEKSVTVRLLQAHPGFALVEAALDGLQAVAPVFVACAGIMPLA
jgi:alpha-galactosidase